MTNIELIDYIEKMLGCNVQDDQNGRLVRYQKVTRDMTSIITTLENIRTLLAKESGE